MKFNKRQLGYYGEGIVKDYYLNKRYMLKSQNFTIRGGEIDLIFQKSNQIIFIEVKIIDNTEYLDGYITKKKLNFLKKTLDYYIKVNKITLHPRLDIVFVRDGNIYQIYDDILFEN